MLEIGLIVPGRPVLTTSNLKPVDDTHAFFELSKASTIQHVCVFLLGNVPEGFGVGLHLHKGDGKGFQWLGFLSNEKPSAIFRLRGTYSSSSVSGALTSAAEAMQTDTEDTAAMLGLSIEPLSHLQPQLMTSPPTTRSSINPVAEATSMAEKIVKNLFNYISGFVGSGTPGVNAQTTVPMNLIAQWYQNFNRKVANGGVGFLDRED